ncbi:MAG: hypothetical protein M1358_13820 [Chloroflexi bacterium]|nr:hypothetical protein [Chloroflexota bacterium]
MSAKIVTCAVVGLKGVIVEVEVDLSAGLPRMNTVRFPAAAVQKDDFRCLIYTHFCITRPRGESKISWPDIPH